MKKIITISLLLTCILTNASEKEFFKNQLLSEKVVVSDTLLVNIQTKIIDAFVVAVDTKNTTELLTIQKQLKELHKEKNQNLILYWQAYSHSFLSLFYTIDQDKKQAEKAIDRGIEILENIENKNSEDCALLALMQNFSIQFKGMKVVFITQDVKENANHAISLDSSNLRAYYVLGINDFFTPSMFGGGDEVEKYLKKAISLPSQKIKNQYLPSWGKDDAYEYLIRFYIREKRWQEAKKYYKEGCEKYPNRYAITKLGGQLEGK